MLFSIVLIFSHITFYYILSNNNISLPWHTLTLSLSLPLTMSSSLSLSISLYHSLSIMYFLFWISKYSKLKIPEIQVYNDFLYYLMLSLSITPHAQTHRTFSHSIGSFHILYIQNNASYLRFSFSMSKVCHGREILLFDKI